MARKSVKTEEKQKVKSANTVTIEGVKLTYRTDLTAEDQGFVPALDPNYVAPASTFDVASDLNENRCCLATGHAGTGKTSIFEWLAAQRNQPCIKVVLNAQMTTGELVGYWFAKGGEMVWVDGVLTKAMRFGWWVIIDEIDNADANVMVALNSVTEPLNSVNRVRKLVLKEKDGEVVHAHPEFRIVATANTAGCMEEFRRLYPGRNKLDFAFLSRFRVYYFDYLLPEHEVDVIVAKTDIPVKTATNMVIVGNQIRAAFANGEVQQPCSPRQLLDWGQLIARRIVRAQETTDLSKLSPADADQFIKGLIRDAFKVAIISRVSQADQEVLDRLILMTFG